MATQNFQRNLLLHLYQDGEKKTAALFGLLLPLKREKKTSDTCSLFSLSGDPWPSCLLSSPGLQEAIHSAAWEKRAGLSCMQRGEAVKPSAPKARLFCDRHFSRLRDCKQRAEDMVPCSAESEFPYLWSTALRSARWMPIDGDPGAHETSSPSCNGEP